MTLRGRSRAGNSLVELLVVLLIIVIIGAILFVVGHKAWAVVQSFRK